MNYKVRVATPEDAFAIQAIYAPMVLDTFISFELTPPTVDEMAARIAATLPAYPYLVAEVDGNVVGYVYASQNRATEAYRWSVDVTVYVVSVQRTHLPNSSIKGDGVRVFLSGHDRNRSDA